MPPIEVVELGSGLSDRPVAEEPRPAGIPQPYVLFVSTIEIRKNHRLLVRVWRRLMERHGADAVPVLVFAGQIGWLVDDLLAELAASDYLGGKIVLMPGLSDAELRQAYRGCLFTVFPSLCEGWGLPVAESLAQGKFCVASNRTSIPEVGGDLIDYFDPIERRRCAREDRARPVRSGLSGGARSAAAGRIPPPQLERLRSRADRQARSTRAGRSGQVMAGAVGVDPAYSFASFFR